MQEFWGVEGRRHEDWRELGGGVDSERSTIPQISAAAPVPLVEQRCFLSKTLRESWRLFAQTHGRRVSVEEKGREERGSVIGGVYASLPVVVTAQPDQGHSMPPWGNERISVPSELSPKAGREAVSCQRGVRLEAAGWLGPVAHSAPPPTSAVPLYPQPRASSLCVWVPFSA